MANPRLEVTEKKCKRCKKVKTASEFYEDTALKCSKDRLTSWCRECMQSYSRVRMRGKPYERGRSIYLRSKYGISREEYNQLLEEQNGVCAICKSPETRRQYSKVMELAVDHNHEYGYVRGLLCTDCNHGIGFLKEDIARFTCLLQYLANPPIEQALKDWYTQPHSRKFSRSKSATARRYKISIETYEALLKFQQGLCAVCNLPETRTIKGKIKSLAVDHHHESGVVRGLLCERCNHALGNFKDNPHIIEEAIKYLQRHVRTC